MPRVLKILAVVLVMGFLAAGTFAFYFAKRSAATSVPRGSNESVIYLDQAWSQEDRNTFYWIPQGTVLMSFRIYENLELADSPELFRSDANIERYG